MKLFNQTITHSALFFLAWTGQAVAEINLNFGLYASDKPTAVVAQFRPLLSELEKRLSQRWRRR